ncbi:cytochrome P450 [Hypoxylon sp. FL1857]|nr:cytochrome P450 [Hypoxylon sp. FL1857]
MANSLTFTLLEAITLWQATTFSALFLALSFLYDLWTQPRLSKLFPRVGNGKGITATVKDWVGYIREYGKWQDDGYERYSKDNRSYLIPSGPSRPMEIVVPRSQTKWMLDQPDSVLSSLHALNDVLFTDYNFLEPGFANGQYGIHVIHRCLARKLPLIIPDLEDEIIDAMDLAFGTDTDNWKSVNVWDAWMIIVPRVVTRLLVGHPVSRDQVFLDNMVKFTADVVRNICILNMFPKVTHPVVGRLLAIPNWWHWRKSYDIILPILEKRLYDMERQERSDPSYDNWNPPENFVTWFIRLAKEEGRFDVLSPFVISRRMLQVEFAAIHTTVLTGHSLVLDLLSSDPSKGFLEAIREEMTTVLREEGGKWTKQGLSRLYCTDSAIRESMRLSCLAPSLTKRKVIAKEGVTNPVEGWHAPYGSYLMLSLSPIHLDEKLYENPEEYDAFRFSRVRKEFEARPDEEKTYEDHLKVMNLSMVTTSDKHLAFGHGRHACPGRFFVAHEMKMILAYLLQNWEIRPLQERPKSTWIGQAIIPPFETNIEVKRRKNSV